MKSLGVIDTGLREGRFNIALDQALIDAHRAGEIGDCLRFLQFEPCALLGRHQSLSAEIDEDYCRANGIAVGRRITGGGALYLDQGQLGWELVFHRKSLAVAALPELTRIICEAAAQGLAGLGIPARFRPRNDIEVDGRKISGTGGFFDGDTIFFQGTLLLDCDHAAMGRALRLPEAKLARHARAPGAARVIGLRELLGTAPALADVKQHLLAGLAGGLGFDGTTVEPAPTVLARAADLYRDDIGTNAFVRAIDFDAHAAGSGQASCAAAGGTLCALVRLAAHARGRVASVLLTGDFFAAPPRLVFDLEASLRDCAIADIERLVGEFFARADIELLSIEPRAIAATIRAAAAEAATCVAAETRP